MAEWLKTLGLEQYAETFAGNDINYGVLPDLSELDLERLGLSVGHRKKLLRAIEALTTVPPVQDPAAAAAPRAKDAAAPQRREAERRQLTVMFSDIVGSTPLSQALDPEDLSRLIDEYRTTCGAVVKRYDGHIAHYAGDGVMVYFGYPRAHEDDPARAVHAALEILSAVKAIAGPVRLEVRVGISTGEVVVGEDVLNIRPKSTDAVGETPNIAARLQAIGDANSVLISASTKRLVSATFDCQDLGFRELKGVARPLQVFRVRNVRPNASRFEAAHPGDLTPLTGRSTDVSLLLDRWQKAKEGDGQAVLLSGVAGVGKSRLIHELKLSVQDESYYLLQFQCSPYHPQSAFHPVIEYIERAADLTDQESDADKLAKLKSYLAQANEDVAEATWLITNLLSIAAGAGLKPADLTPQQIKNKTLSKLVDMVLDLAAQRPTLCVFEDVHWIDPSTLELLDLLINRIGEARVLVIVSYRPEFQPRWPTHTNVTTHSVTRLSRREVGDMIRDLSGREHIPPQVLSQIVERTDGVPLFIEELTHNVLKSPKRARNAEGDLDQATQHAILKVPETLHDSLMERLDRVPQGRRTAQLAAVIGREFAFDLLHLASGIADSDLRSTLSRLEDADIIYRVGISPVLRFAFKHALLCDAIYNSILKTSRQKFHADIAAILERRFRESAEVRPELLAYHYSQAQMPEPAAHNWYESGQRAVAQSANVEAIAHFHKALEALGQLPDSPARADEEIKIQLALGIPLIAVRGYAAEETRRAFSRARTLCASRNNPPEQFQALFGLWGNLWMGGKNGDALAMAEEILARSQSSPDSVPLMVAHRTMGSTLLTAGAFQPSRQHFEITLELSDQKGKEPLHSLYMVNPEAAALLLLSWDLWFLGFADQALSRVTEGLALARDLAQPYNIAFGHYMCSVVHLLRGEPARALARAEKSLEISEEQRFSLYALLS
ncbi:MAG: adenylate/guanylate cyclase domain-containing protein, partial [Candidatus Eiseniibacteriota bacterium]